jgi:transcription initiation factor IIE alpha subunit
MTALPTPRDAPLVVDALGIDATRLLVLRTCLEHGAVSSGAVAALLGIAKNTARKHLELLERTRVVTRTRRSGDGRRWSFVWTGNPDAVRDLVDDLDLFLGARD